MASNAQRSGTPTLIARPIHAMTGTGMMAPENSTAGKHSIGRVRVACDGDETAADANRPSANAAAASTARVTARDAYVLKFAAGSRSSPRDVPQDRSELVEVAIRIYPVETHPAAVGRSNATECLQEAGLPGPATTSDHYQLPWLDHERYVVEDLYSRHSPLEPLCLDTDPSRRGAGWLARATDGLRPRHRRCSLPRDWFTRSPHNNPSKPATSKQLTLTSGGRC